MIGNPKFLHGEPCVLWWPREAGSNSSLIGLQSSLVSHPNHLGTSCNCLMIKTANDPFSSHKFAMPKRPQTRRFYSLAPFLFMACLMLKRGPILWCDSKLVLGFEYLSKRTPPSSRAGRCLNQLCGPCSNPLQNQRVLSVVAGSATTSTSDESAKPEERKSARSWDGKAE